MKSPISRRPAPARLTLPQGTIGVGTEGNIGLWNPVFGRWGDLATPGAPHIRSLARSPSQPVSAVTTDGSFCAWRGDHWGDPSRLANWTLNMLAWRHDSVLLGVSTAGKLGMMGSDRWFEQNNGGWTLKMIAWNAGLRLVGVGANGNVGLWNGTGWTDQGLMGGWTLKMTAFDQGGVQWGVGTLGNVGWWNGGSWTDFGTPGGWTLDWLLFP